ncbi:MAG: hypothetical protein LUH11_03215 [Candidatus Gastranaerophilales bacterium]|nr:hypothetical protein [Candidatus Gastranaerophilales bacterium]
MSKGCIISDLDKLRTDYQCKMLELGRKEYKTYQTREQAKKRFKSYERAFEQLNNLLINLSRHHELLERVI